MKWLFVFPAFLAAGGTAEAAGFGGWICPRGWGQGLMWGFPGGMFMMFLLLLLGVVVVYLLLKRQGESRPMEASRETPLEILKRRYAKGEITREEFEEMKKDL
jgi:putative membrane protein